MKQCVHESLCFFLCMIYICIRQLDSAQGGAFSWQRVSQHGRQSALNPKFTLPMRAYKNCCRYTGSKCGTVNESSEFYNYACLCVCVRGLWMYLLFVSVQAYVCVCVHVHAPAHIWVPIVCMRARACLCLRSYQEWGNRNNFAAW